MKFQVGDKVKYESGDWWFCGAVTAVIENSICPSYRLHVDTMIKKNCKFAITQFEFELEADDTIDSHIAKSRLEKSENQYIKQLNTFQNNTILPPVVPSDITKIEAEPIIKPAKKEKVIIMPNPVETLTENVDTPMATDIKPQKPKLKRDKAWENVLELYQNGVKSNQIYTWMYQNRKLYNSGKLPDRKLEKLIEINFPFEVKKKAQNKK